MSFPESDNFFETPALVSGQPSPPFVLGRDGLISFEVAPTGGNMTGLKVQTQMHAKGAWNDDIVDTDFASSTIPAVQRASATPPNATTNNNVGWAQLRLGLVKYIRFLPTLSAGTVTIRGVK